MRHGPDEMPPTPAQWFDRPMDPLDFGDMTDLRIRLQGLTEETDRRLVTVFGSGISNAVLPNVTELTQLFRHQMPSRGLDRFDERVTPLLGTPLGYQNAASLLTYQAGEQAVMRAIRSAVLRACRDVPEEEVSQTARNEEQCRNYVKDGSWNVPLGYQRFARFFSSLSGKVRGPIITTNFDPLIEIALREEDIPAEPIPIPVDSAPTPAQLREASTQPVLHIHGYWTGRATSNVPSRITADRPQLDQVLQELLRNSIVLVVGYSGWADGFMKSLYSRILNEAALLESDVLWAAYDKDPEIALNEGALKDLLVAPGFSLYLGVDGHELFVDELDRGSSTAEESPSPFGYTHVPRYPVSPRPNDAHFADGGQPEWADATPGHWPTLTSTRALEEKLLSSLNRGGGSGAVALGPLGEGKSLAVRQVAMAVAASRHDWSVLWREAGAPPITKDWLKRVRDSFGPTLICIDEADLVADELVSTQDFWGTENSGLALLLASHDRLWQRSGKHLRPAIPEVLFHGITSEDADCIADAWQRMGLLPNSKEDVHDATSAAERLNSSAGLMAAKSNTLFGAVLDVRYGPQLGDRVKDLIEKLRKIKLSEEISLGDVFAGICVIQDALDRNGSLGKGASRPIIAAMVGLDTVFADGKILETLGREAAVTFAGTRVYSRHPAIASAVVQLVHEDGTAEKIYTLVGHAGGVLRNAGARDDDGYRDTYLISRNLRVPEAVWAATGAVKGAGPRILEPRVTLLSAKRRENASKAISYAQALAPRVYNYDDFHSAIRPFLVEFSISMREEGLAQTSAGLAALALDDRVGFTLDVTRAGYALVALVKSTHTLNVQTKEGPMVSAPELAYVLLERIQGSEQATRHLGGIRNQLKDSDRYRRMSATKICGRLSSMLQQAMIVALKETKLDIEISGPPAFDTLRRLIENTSH